MADHLAIPRKLWENPDPYNTNMAAFIRFVNNKRGTWLKTFQDLYAWSIGNDREQFWQDAWEFLPIIHEGTYQNIIEPNVRMDHVPRWFQGVRLNYAENVLYKRSATATSTNEATTTGKEDSKIAITEVREGCTEIRNITWKELRSRVGKLASAMRAHGVVKGDRVAVVAGNSLDTLCVFLAVTSLGGLFSSSSTDMGAKGVLDRLLQIHPRWVFMDDAALYNGKKVDLRAKMTEIVNGMQSVDVFQGVVSCKRWDKALDLKAVPKSRTMNQFLSKATTDQLEFERVEFNDPYLVVYSSGTTGQPKCIVHAVGRVVLSSFKEGVLHRGANSSTVTLQYTTTGWIMYQQCVVGLLHGGRVVLYDGSPFQPNAESFVKLIGDQKVTNLGISPKWMQTLIAAKIVPKKTTDLSSLRTVVSTGMVLPESLFYWFYDVGFPPNVNLANISGGTDLAGCFGLDNPLTPLYAGGCQGPSLGTAIAVYDQTIESHPGQSVTGKELPRGEAGELVASKSFPNMPVAFWSADPEQGKKRYFDAYFARFDNVWTHGDFVQIHPKTGQLLFLGRADGVLNPSGVRFGSAEIYNVVEQWFPTTIADSIVVGQRRPQDHDEAVMMFLKMQPGVPFSPVIVQEVKDTIARECSKRHVPKYIFETPEIPTTVNLKKVELPVKQIVSGKVVKPSGTLLNPDSLDYYYQFAKVEDLVKAQRTSKL